MDRLTYVERGKENYTALSTFANNSFPKHQNLRLGAGVVHLKLQQ